MNDEQTHPAQPQGNDLFTHAAANEALVQKNLTAAGPSAYAPSQFAANSPEAKATPGEVGEPSYIARNVSAAAEPVIVTGQPPLEGVLHSAAPATAPAPAMTASAVPPQSYSERPADKQQPRYGQIRTREAVIPPSVERNKRTLSIDAENATIGAIMSDARKQAGLSIAQAEQLTHIKKNYITALENDDAKELPTGIFPTAYVRSLCGAYNLNDAGREIALRKVRETFAVHDPVPDQFIHNLEQNVQRNVAEEQRVNKIFYLAVAGAATLLVLLIAGIILITLSLHAPSPQKTDPDASASAQTRRSAPVSNFDAARLETLTPVQIPALMRTLPPAVN